MRTHEKYSSANMLCMALAIAFYSVMVFPQDAAAEPSAAEIMAKSQAAMSQPLKFRQIAGDVEMVVYQKPLPDGSLAILMDMSSPIKKTDIIYGDKSYELYLEHRVAFDTQFMFQSAKSKAASAASLLGDKATQFFNLVGTVQRDGKDCYEIESTLTPDMLAALAKVLPPGSMDMVPAMYRYVIEKDTYLMVEQETISRNGSSLSKVEFRDIKPQPDLSDDFFQLPPGLEVNKPKSMAEYMTLLGDMLAPKASIVTARRLEPPPLVMPPKTAFPKFHPSKRLPTAQSGNPVERVQSQAMTTGRLIALVTSSVVFVVLLTVIVVLHRLKKAK